jgi:hypothetical protein
MPKLYDVIKADLSAQLNKALPNSRLPASGGLNVIMLAGNGLTRLAGYSFGIKGSSWRDCVKQAWEQARPERGTFGALERQGKSLPSIFDLAVHQSESKRGVDMQEIWEPFWKAVEEVESKQLHSEGSTLHRAILDACRR